MTAQLSTHRPAARLRRRRTRPLGRSTRVLIGVEAFTALNAFWGAWYAIGGAPNVPLEWLDGTPFHSYAVPGLILAAVGGSLSIAAVGLWRRRPSARLRSDMAGLVLLVWIVAQVAMIGYVSPLQPIMAAVAVLILWLTRRVPA